MSLDTLEHAVAEARDANLVYSVSPTGQVIALRWTYYEAADASDPLIQHIFLNRASAVRKALELRGLGDAIQRPWRD
jgi:hypothetical protein